AAAAAKKQEQASEISAVPTPMQEGSTPWRRIDDIGSGLYLCGAAALENKAELERLGIRGILNCAKDDLYSRSYSDGVPLRTRLDGYAIEVLEAEDIEEQPMRDLWVRAVEFLDRVLREGGCVAVHCAQGVSRSASTCLAYLMIREGLSLEAAFRRVFDARDFIRPNPGFWQQLRDLEASLGKAGGVIDQQDAAGQAILRLDEELRQKKLAVAAGWL
ncbi:DSPTP1, partial [Symbiodinium pilosum]